MKLFQIIIVLIVSVFFISNLKAEQDTSKLKLSGAYIAIGSPFLWFPVFTDLKFGLLMKNSVYKSAQDDLIFTENPDRYAPQIRLLLPEFGVKYGGFEFKIRSKNPERLAHQLRLGLFSIRNQYVSRATSISKIHLDRIIVDSVRSSTFNETYLIYQDRYKFREFDIFYSNSQIGIDASYIIRMLPENRFSLYCGVGAFAGIIYNAHSYIHYYETTDSEYSIQGVYYGNYGYSSLYKTELLKNKGGYFLGLTCLTGLNFQISKQSEFWSKCSLYVELKPSTYFTYIPELTNRLRSFMSGVHGFRYSF